MMSESRLESKPMTQASPPARSRKPAATPVTMAGAAGPAPSMVSDLKPQRKVETDKDSRILRVLCVDDHAVLIVGLIARFAIDGGIEVVGRLSTAAKLIEEVVRLKPDVVILDIEMPGPDAFEMADRLKHLQGETRVMVLSAHIRDAFISAAFRSGVGAYFSKSDELSDIVRGIHEVAKGPATSFILGPRVRERCRPLSIGGGTVSAEGQDNRFDRRTGSPITLLSSLTVREAEILRFIGKGLSRIQIAAELCRSAKTVDAHQARMMTKLGITSRSDLLRFAIREGLAEA